MVTPSAITILKILETLPEQLQDRVVEHVRDYVEDLKDEAKWDESFYRTQKNLEAAARQARREIAAGKATPLDIEKL